SEALAPSVLPSEKRTSHCDTDRLRIASLLPGAWLGSRSGYMHLPPIGRSSRPGNHPSLSVLTRTANLLRKLSGWSDSLALAGFHFAVAARQHRQQPPARAMGLPFFQNMSSKFMNPAL